MDFKKFASEASQKLNRVVQLAEETVGQSERTEYDEEYQKLCATVDMTRTWTERLIANTQEFLQPNPSSRMTDFINSQLDRRAEATLEVESLGGTMTTAAAEIGVESGYGKSLDETGKAELELGKVQRDFMKKADESFTTPLREFLNGDMKNIDKERETLEGKRLDLDASKSRLKKAQANSAQEEALKKAEAETAAAQADFDGQMATTKKLMTEFSNDLCLKCLKAFVECQQQFYTDSAKVLADVQGKL